MELRQLKTFLTVAHLNSFQQAAQVLHLAQSTVSEQIKMLEQDLNIKLFERMGRQIRLTESGQLLIQYSEKMMTIEAEISSCIPVHGSIQGTMALRVPETISTYILPQVLIRFHEAFTKVQLDLHSCSYFSLEQELKTDLIQLAFLITDDPYQVHDLVTEKLAVVPLVLVGHPENPLSKKRSVETQELQSQIILLPKEDCNYHVMFEQTLLRAKIKPALLHQLNSLEAIKQCVMRGTGLTLLPRISAREELASGRLVEISWTESPLVPHFLMIYYKFKQLSPYFKAFAELIRERSADLFI